MGSVLYLTDEAGNIRAVQVPLDLWRRLEPHARSLDAEAAGGEDAPRKEPLDEFRDFLHYWDFRYPYDPAVACPQCGAATKDWREGEERPFRLTAANIGGLLVFRCQGCRTTIRQKHFRDHVSVEHTPWDDSAVG